MIYDVCFLMNIECVFVLVIIILIVIFFSHEYGNNDYCKNNGLCFRQNPNEDRWNFVCLCPECLYGSQCRKLFYYITYDNNSNVFN